MRLIKAGAVSGLLPSDDAFVVHYPGYPSTTSRALDTLGGVDAISKARSSQSNKLELRFRPEDPYSHPAFGELHPCNNFLLKISKKKHNQRAETDKISSCSSEADPSNSEGKHCCTESFGTVQEVSQSETDVVASTKAVETEVPEEDLSADIIARVSEAYYFNGMADYQHVVAVHGDVARRKKRGWAEQEPSLDHASFIDVDQEDLMALLPPLFSPKDIPEKLVLRPSVTLSSKKKQEGVVQHRWEMDIEPCLALDFGIKKIPRTVNWKDYVPQDSDQWGCQVAVSELFDERPIWPKQSLTKHLFDKGFKVGAYMLRRLLFRTAYYFSSGPYLRFWIRKGYDPREDPESRIYQRIDFRVPPPLRSYCDAAASNGSKHRWDDICAFRVFPYKCQTSLQLFELADVYIQQEIRKPSKQTTCSCATGWFPVNVLNSLRLCVAVRFLSVYPKAGAENLLKSVSERFEKSKRMHKQTTNLRNNDEGQWQVNQGNEDQEEPNAAAAAADDNDGKVEDEEEIEDNNDEEEPDEYDALHLAGEDGDFSLQTDSYMENLPNSYLQELFGSFSSAGAIGGKVSDADTMDEEYDIYDQDSDDNSDEYVY